MAVSMDAFKRVLEVDSVLNITVRLRKGSSSLLRITKSGHVAIKTLTTKKDALDLTCRNTHALEQKNEYK